MSEEETITSAELCLPLEKNADSLKMRGVRGELLVIEDLFNNVPFLPDDVKIFCLDTSAPADLNESSAKEISPGLSFLWTKNGVEKFSSPERLNKSLSEFRKLEYGRRVIGETTFEFVPNQKFSNEVVHSLSLGVDALLNYSLNAVNKSQDQIDTLSRDFLLEVSRVNGRFDLSDLADFLGQAAKLNFGLLHLARLPEATITVSKASSSPESLTGLCEFLGLPLDTFSTEPHGEQDPYPAIRLQETVAAELILNAGKWGKALVSAIPGDLKKRILILPIIRPLGPRLDRKEHTSRVLAASDLLFTFTNELNRHLMDRLRVCVDTFSQYRYGAQRFNLLSQIQKEFPFDISGTSLRIGPSIGDMDEPRIKETLLPLLNEVLYTTSAHSVSVRIFDPSAKALIVEAVAASGDSAPSSAGPPIPIKSNFHTSVAAFMFLSACPELPHVYLRRISPPERRQIKKQHIEKHRTFVPPQYRSLGLQTPQITRDLTRSEICFALMKGHLAFGTLNLEAPYPYAFDNDIPYLTLIKTGIEKLYNSVAERLDARWLIANAARSDAVHELRQFQEAKTFFNKEQDDLLCAIFPPRSNIDLSKAQDLRSLQDTIVSWASQRWIRESELRRSVTEMIQFYHLDDCAVDGILLEAATVILKNIIQNSVKHGEPTSDRLSVDDRPWLGIRKTRCLRIQYRSTQSASAEVIKVLCVAPIQLAPDKRIAYGMYNVGLLTRLLGGSLYVTSRGPNSQLTVDIHLPIPERRQ